MRVSFNWLKECVEIDMSVTRLADMLTMAGLEVETVEAVGRNLENIIIGRILGVNKHPKADRLSVCRVHTGHEEVSVVCGAPNVAPGVLAPLSLPGTRLPNGVLVEETRIRGEKSVGMLLAEDELGLTDDHSGVMILPESWQPGTSLNELPLEDWALEISITPNRPDCTSLIGIAREVAALTGRPLKKPKVAIDEEDIPIESLTRVTIEDPAGCPRYAAGIVQDVDLQPSPFWMRYRLHTSGIRTINNIVDITNYILLETGQPLHSFDYERLKENRIVVRRAKGGETFTTLDGQARSLDEHVLMICDGERSVAIAGIMGGLNSEIYAGSKHVLLESAFFDPVTIRQGSKKLGLSTEASYRFERGIDLEGVPHALKRAMMLMSALAGGRIARGIIDNYPRPHRYPEIPLRLDRTNAFLGTSITKEKMAGYLEALEMTVEASGGNELLVTPPAFRVDIVREVDLMEEVARLEGYDSIPVTYPAVRPADRQDPPELKLGDKARDLMVGLGFTECVTFGFIPEESPDVLGAPADSPLRSSVRLLKPLTKDQSIMRTSLRPGLLMTMQYNIARGVEDLKLFEWGKVFFHVDGEELPTEKLSLTAAVTGLFVPQTCHSKARPVDFFDVKGVLDSFLQGLGLGRPSYERGDTPPGYDPDFSATVSMAGIALGAVGRVAPEVMERYDMASTEAYVLELDLESLIRAVPGRPVFRPFPKYPAVFRDLTVIVHKKVESARIAELIEKQGGNLVESVRMIDLYEGDRMASSEKALTYRIAYRSKEGTLDGVAVNRIHEGIIERIHKETGGRLPGS